MASENLQLKNSCADHHEEISSPVLRVLQVNDRGMVFESRNDFEIGDIIELGFHVKYFAGPNQPEGRVERTEFITAHGVIVSSMLCASADGNLVHEVAMLFHEMDRRDSRALRRFTEMEGQRKSLGQEHGPEEDAVSGMIGMN
tara:strand:+ start:2409 stop:2837 length:429 start_codon:yes stop_codon:yes gene_type:complete